MPSQNAGPGRGSRLSRRGDRGLRRRPLGEGPARGRGRLLRQTHGREQGPPSARPAWGVLLPWAPLQASLSRSGQGHGCCSGQGGSSGATCQRRSHWGQNQPTISPGAAGRGLWNPTGRGSETSRATGSRWQKRHMGGALCHPPAPLNQHCTLSFRAAPGRALVPSPGPRGGVFSEQAFSQDTCWGLGSSAGGPVPQILPLSESVDGLVTSQGGRTAETGVGGTFWAS